MKKIKILASKDEDKIVFVVQKTKNMDRLEVVGMLQFIIKEVLDGMGEKIKVEKKE